MKPTEGKGGGLVCRLIDFIFNVNAKRVHRKKPTARKDTAPSRGKPLKHNQQTQAEAMSSSINIILPGPSGGRASERSIAG